MPLSLSRAFVEVQSFPSSRVNEYADGASQRSAMLPLARRTWQLSKHVPASTLIALRDFWVAQGTAPFYFYNPKETSPAFSYDATGVATVGRYRVRFTNAWNQSLGIGALLDVNVELVQVFRHITGLADDLAIMFDTGAIVGGHWNLTDSFVPTIWGYADTLVDAFAPLTMGGIAIFSVYYGVTQLCGVLHDAATVKWWITRTWRTIGAATYEAIYQAAANTTAKTIIMLSQGVQCDGSRTRADALAACTSRGVRIIAAGLGPIPDLGFLAGLAAATGGAWYPDCTPASLADLIADNFTIGVGN